MSPNCEYTKTDLGKADARCVGCKWREQNELAIPTTSTSAVDSEANQSVCEAAARPDAGGSVMTPQETLDWLAQQHFDQCREERPIQDWIRKMKSQLPKENK
jgi:hypothetical protein